MIDVTKAKAVISIDGDASGLKRAIADVNKAEDDLGKKQLDRANAHNARLQSTIEMFGKMAAVAGVAAVAGKALWEGLEHNARKAQLTMNAAGVDVDRLRKGFGGLRTEMQSLEIASMLANSKIRLTGDQMETVGKAMRQLVREGHSWDEVSKKVTDAFVKLKGSGLDDFGILVRDAKTEGDKFNAVLEAMSSKAGKLTDTTNTAAESIDHYQAKFTDAMESIKAGIGRVAEVIAKLLDVIPKGWLDMSGAAPGASMVLARAAPEFIENIQRNLELRSAQLLATYGVGGRYNVTRLEPPPTVGPAKVRPGRGGGGKDPWLQAIEEMLTPYQYRDFTPERTNDDLDPALRAFLQRSTFRPRQRMDVVSDPYGYEKFNAARSESKLEGIFGPLSEFDAYKTAFETLNGAVGSAFGAWIDGSASAGVAFKRFIGEALKGVAVQMAMEAIKHAAYGLGNLAFGNFAGAAAHAKAAAAFAAGAITVGAAAKTMHSGGGGGTGASAPGGGVPAYSGSGNGGQQQGQTIVVAYGQDYSNDSARQRQLRAAKVLEDAKGAVGNGAVSYP